MFEILVAVSIIIPSAKTEIHTLKSLGHESEVIISRKAGLGKARNYGAKASKREFLVFFDDDLELKPGLWKFLLSLKRGEFAIAQNCGFPCSRVLAIHKADFWRVGGFDESIVWIGEDVVFYLHALNAGLKCRVVPNNLYLHKYHKPRSANRRVGILIGIEFCKLFVKYKRGLQANMFEFFLSPIKKRHFRDAVFKFFCVAYWILRGV